MHWKKEKQNYNNILIHIGCGLPAMIDRIVSTLAEGTPSGIAINKLH